MPPSNLPTVHVMPVAVSGTGRVYNRPDLIPRMARPGIGVAVPSGPLPGPSGAFALRAKNPAVGGYQPQQAVPIAMADPPVGAPNTQRLCVQGIADPFALQWVPIGPGTQAQDPAFAVGSGIFSTAIEFASMGGTVDKFGRNINHGGPLLKIAPVRSVEWYHVTVWATEIVQLLTAGTPTEGEVLAAPQNSMLRARVRWSQRQGYERAVDVDIGTGVDIWVPPTNQIEVELLVPNPATTPVGTTGNKYPTWFTTTTEDGDPAYQYISCVTASAYPVCSPVSHPPNRLTFNAFSESVDAGINTIPVIPVPPNARYCQISSNEETDNPEMFWLFDQANIGSVIGSFNFPAGSRTTENVLVPQHAKAMRIVFTANVARTLSVSFELQQ